MGIDVRGYLRDLAGRRDLLLYIGAAALYWMGTGGVLPYLTRFGVSVLGLSEGESFQLILPALAGTIIAAVPAGYIADRRGKKPVLAVGLLAYSLIALVASQVATLPQALIAMGVIGLANGVWTSLAVRFSSTSCPRARAEMTASGPRCGHWRSRSAPCSRGCCASRQLPRVVRRSSGFSSVFVLALVRAPACRRS